MAKPNIPLNKQILARLATAAVDSPGNADRLFIREDGVTYAQYDRISIDLDKAGPLVSFWWAGEKVYSLPRLSRAYTGDTINLLALEGRAAIRLDAY